MYTSIVEIPSPSASKIANAIGGTEMFPSSPKEWKQMPQVEPTKPDNIIWPVECHLTDAQLRSLLDRVKLGSVSRTSLFYSRRILHGTSAL